MRLFIATILVVSLLINNAQAEEKLNEELISRDLYSANLLLENLPSKLDQEQWSRLQFLMTGRESRNLGFGFISRLSWLPAGYTSITIEALEFNDALVFAKISYHCDQQLVCDTLPPALKKLRKSNSDELMTFTNQDLIELGIRNIGKNLKLEFSDAVLHRNNDFNLLINPNERFEYGAFCGDGGDAPTGREAIENLIEQGQGKLITSLLQSPNPEGRIYAVEALFRQYKQYEKIPTDYQMAIEKIAVMSPAIRVCGGCIVNEQSAEEIISEFKNGGKVLDEFVSPLFKPN